MFLPAWRCRRWRRCAILAVLIIGSGSGAAPAGSGPFFPDPPPAAPVPPERGLDAPPSPDGDDLLHTVQPVPVRFRLAEGTRFSGRLTAWSREHLEGTFGKHRWVELHWRDVWNLHRRLMDGASAEHWLDLGRLLMMMSLEQPSSAEYADRAFAKAERLQEDLSERIAQIRQEFLERKKLREEARRTALSTDDPEAAHWPADPWPEMGPADQHAALRALRADADEIASEAGLLASPLDTGHFLLYGDLSAQRLAAIGTELQRVYAMLADLLEVEQPGNVFWGRAVVYVVPTEDRFRLLQAQRFQHVVDRQRVATAHFIGPQAYILIRQDADDTEFAATLPHVVTHAFLHRMISPRRLPPWANEGLAEYIAAQRTRGQAQEESTRAEALSFIREGGDVMSLVSAAYGSELWLGGRGVSEPVGGLLVELLIDTDAAGFVRWVKAVKKGEEWTEALTKELGLSAPQFAQTAVRFYRVND